ncbi:hypothetical protein [Neisseria sp.]|uniref:hypothetical protein n=1 Tax=Neisseria sp. TaxID=192066 RepID=UPI0035A145A0
MTKAEANVFYFVRVSVYALNAAKIPVLDKPGRIWVRIIECPPLKSTEDLFQYIIHNFDDIFDRESEMCVLDAVTPVCWPQQSHMVLTSPDTGTGLGDITSNTSDSSITILTKPLADLISSEERIFTIEDPNELDLPNHTKRSPL